MKFDGWEVDIQDWPHWVLGEPHLLEHLLCMDGGDFFRVVKTISSGIGEWREF